MSTEKIEVKDKTIEGAIKKGLEQLGINRDNASIEVLSEPSSGILGIWGNREARVSMSPIHTPLSYLEYMLGKIIEEVDPDGIISIKEEGTELYVDIKGSDMGVLIGKKGQTLEALQYLMNVIMHRQFENFNGRVIIDIEGYRERRRKYISDMATKSARKAVKIKKEVVLEPMSGQDRRLVHLSLKDDPYVETYSSGDEPYRKVVIKPLRQ